MSDKPKAPTKEQLYRMCCGLILDCGLAGKYDPRVMGLKSVPIADILERGETSGSFTTRPLTKKEVREMVHQYFRDGRHAE